MKRSLITLGLVALCANGTVFAPPTAADIKRQVEGFSITITNNSNEDVYLAGFYGRNVQPLITEKIPAHSKNREVIFDVRRDIRGGNIELQKVTVQIGQQNWKTFERATHGGYVTVEQKDVDYYMKKRA